MASNLSFDLYELHRGRWTLAQQYSDYDKGGAIAKAREMFATGGFEAVAVMRELYDPGSGASQGTLVYSDTKSADVPKLHGRTVTPEATARPESQASRQSDEDEDDFDIPAAPRAARTTTHSATGAVFGKIVTLLIVSFLLSGGTWFVLSRFGLESSLVDLFGERDLPLKVIIAGLFLYTLILGPALVSRSDLQAIFYSSDGDADPAPRRAAASRGGARGGAASRASRANRAAAELPEEEIYDDEDAKDDEDEEDEEDAPPELKLDKKTARKLAASRKTMVAFFELCLRFINDAELPTKTGKLDPLLKFGCHLYFAGAAEALCQIRGLPPTVLVKVLEPCVIALGRDPEQARAFVEKYEEYLLEPSYNDMFRVGRDAMEAYVGDERKAAAAAGDDGSESEEDGDVSEEDGDVGEEDGDKGSEAVVAAPAVPRQSDDAWEKETDIGIFLLHALEDFASPTSRKEKKKADSGTMAVMFTYMVGLDQVTEKHGDGVARRVTGVHDTVVRGAIREENGREVKHTGEGIMAAFEKSGDAVSAAVIMQRGFNEYNLGDSDVPLHVKIGVNAGEPIVEGDDIFGTTVQVAARLAQNAVADQILVSTVVRELSGGNDLEFTSAGTREFKGVPDPVPVFEAVWRRSEEDAADATDDAADAADA